MKNFIFVQSKKPIIKVEQTFQVKLNIFTSKQRQQIKRLK